MTQPVDQRGDTSWLVVIDMQNVFADPESPWATPGFAAILDHHAALLTAFGDRVVFTRFVAPEVPVGAWQQYYEEWPFALSPPDDPMYDVVDALSHTGRAVVARPTFGKWDEQRGSIRELTGGAETLVMAGVSTDCCVLSTALAAADAGIRVEVVGDACAGLSDADHERALSAMRLYAPLIIVTTTAELLRRP